jgi:hypothetical protein
MIDILIIFFYRVNRFIYILKILEFVLKEKFKVELIKTSEELPSLLIEVGNKKMPIHSKKYPSREFNRYLEFFIPEQFNTLIVLGVGLGYHLKPLNEVINKYSKVILIDIIEEINNYIKDIKPVKFLVLSEKIIFLSGLSISDIESKLKEIIDIDEISGINVLEHNSSVRIFNDYYSDVKKIILKLINQKAGSGAAKKKFGLLYIKNIIKNLSLFEKFYPVKLLKDKISSYNILVIASGSSLNNYIDLIKENQDRFFIVAVDSAFSVLFKSGIKPDFVISIDPQVYIYEHLQGFDLSNVIFLNSISVNNILMKKNLGNIFLSLNSHPLSQMIEELYPGLIGSIDSSTGNVAGDALKAAVFFGAKNIGMVGFDFSFFNYTIYSRGSTYQKRYAQFFQNRFFSIETANLNYIMKASKSYKYEGKFTRRSFVQYKEAIEDYIKSIDHKNIYSINRHGLNLKNVENIDFSSFVKKCDNFIEKSIILKETISYGNKILNYISLSKIKSIISEEKVFSKILYLSINEKIDSSSGKKIIKLVKKI